METKYHLNQDDYLAYQLFAASINDRIKKQRKWSWIITATAFAAMATLFYTEDNTVLGHYFSMATVVAILFFPYYSRWRYRRHYARYVSETLKNSFGSEIKLEINAETINTVDENGYSTIKTSQLAAVYETGDHFFLKLASGQALIIPKRELGDLSVISGTIKELTRKLAISHMKNEKWKWK